MMKGMMKVCVQSALWLTQQKKKWGITFFISWLPLTTSTLLGIFCACELARMHACVCVCACHSCHAHSDIKPSWFLWAPKNIHDLTRRVCFSICVCVCVWIIINLSRRHPEGELKTKTETKKKANRNKQRSRASRRAHEVQMKCGCGTDGLLM